jgi:rRNA-processing protein FCF1
MGIERDIEEGQVGKEVFENILKYISTIDFKLECVRKVVNALGGYLVLTFDKHFTVSKNDNEHILP